MGDLVIPRQGNIQTIAHFSYRVLFDLANAYSLLPVKGHALFFNRSGQ